MGQASTHAPEQWKGFTAALAGVVTCLALSFTLSTARIRYVVEIQIPRDSSGLPCMPEGTPTLHVASAERVRFGGRALAMSELDSVLHEFFDYRPEKLVVVTSERTAHWGDVIATIARARTAGVKVFAWGPAAKCTGRERWMIH